MIPTRPLLKLTVIHVLLLAPSACGSAGSKTTDAAGPTVVDASPPAQLDQHPAGKPIAFACGRAHGLLPDDSVLDKGRERSCLDPGYPQDIEASGLAGGQSTHVIQRGACALKLVASERVAAPGQSPQDITLSKADGRVETLTPEGSVFRVEITPISATCSDEGTLVTQALRESLRIDPLRSGGSRVRAAISSAGHGFELTAPSGFYVVSSGGMSDQYETSYQLRGPKGAWVTLYSSWRSAADAPPGTFVATLVGPRVRWRGAMVDPATDSEGCRAANALGPEKRLKVELVMCGPREGYAELEQLLTQIRLTPPRS